MNKIILQPAGSPSARSHYIDTIENPVDINLIAEYVDEIDLGILKQIYANKVYVWGVTPGTKLVNKNKWGKIEKGDTALFAWENHINASATVTYKIHNSDLALELRGLDYEKDETWEYIFFVDEIKKLNIPYPIFNKAVGYEDNYIIRSFNVLDEDKSSKIFESFDLISNIYLPEINEYEYDQNSIELEELDTKRETLTRKEQSYLRKKIFNYRTISKCSICDKKINIEFLVCAHIKKRSKCNDEEKRNINNVTPICKFGCDELFERGYIAVENGKIKVIKNSNTEFVNNYLNKIDSKICNVYNESNEQFFKWHKEFHNN